MKKSTEDKTVFDLLRELNLEVVGINIEMNRVSNRMVEIMAQMQSQMRQSYQYQTGKPLLTTDIHKLEEEVIREVYKNNPGIQNREAAKLLNMSERTLYRKLLKLNKIN